VALAVMPRSILLSSQYPNPNVPAFSYGYSSPSTVEYLLRDSVTLLRMLSNGGWVERHVRPPPYSAGVSKAFQLIAVVFTGYGRFLSILPLVELLGWPNDISRLSPIFLIRANPTCLATRSRVRRPLFAPSPLAPLNFYLEPLSFFVSAKFGALRDTELTLRQWSLLSLFRRSQRQLKNNFL